MKVVWVRLASPQQLHQVGAKSAKDHGYHIRQQDRMTKPLPCAALQGKLKSSRVGEDASGDDVYHRIQKHADPLCKRVSAVGLAEITKLPTDKTASCSCRLHLKQKKSSVKTPLCAVTAGHMKNKKNRPDYQSHVTPLCDITARQSRDQRTGGTRWSQYESAAIID